jgi:hypothetical protein
MTPDTPHKEGLYLLWGGSGIFPQGILDFVVDKGPLHGSCILGSSDDRLCIADTTVDGKDCSKIDNSSRSL